MTWQIITAANLVIAGAYFSISAAVGVYSLSLRGSSPSALRGAQMHA